MLQKAPISFTLSLCMSAGNRSLTTEQMYVKFGIGKLHSFVDTLQCSEAEQHNEQYMETCLNSVSIVSIIIYYIWA